MSKVSPKNTTPSMAITKRFLPTTSKSNGLTALSTPEKIFKTGYRHALIAQQINAKRKTALFGLKTNAREVQLNT